MSWAQCSECKEEFGSDRAFDRHRVNMTGQPGYDTEYDWRCATEAEMLGKSWHQDWRGWWRLPDSGSPRPLRTRTATEPRVA